MRCEQWASALYAIVAERRARPFEWGAHDCVMWASDVTVALTGRDPVAHLRGRYDSALGAARLLEDEGGMLGLAARCWGPEIPRLCAQRGDVVLVTGDDGRDSFAVVMGVEALGVGPVGLVPAPMARWQHAWRVD